MVTVSLSEKYREFGTLKSRIRDFFSNDSRFQLLGAAAYSDERRIFECLAVEQRLYISDEIDVAIERAALEAFNAGGPVRSRVDFLRRPEDAGWLQAGFGVTPLPRPATETALGVQHGAALVYSQNETDGSVVVLLYPPRTEKFRRLQKCIVLGYFKSPRFIDETRIRRHVDALIQYQKVVGFRQRSSMRDRFCIWWLINTRVVIWEESTEPTKLRRTEWLIALGTKLARNSTLMAASLVIVYLFGKLLFWLGLTTLGNILLRRPS
jgi:hypothetical protein